MSDANPIESNPWISAKQAVDLLAPNLTVEGAKEALFYRASRGVLKARALQQLYYENDKQLRSENEAVDPRFFRAASPTDSSADQWLRGDFSHSMRTSFDGGYRDAIWEVIGLHFERAGVVTLLEGSRQLDDEDPLLSLRADLDAPSPTTAKGRPSKQHLTAAALVGFKLGRQPIAKRIKPTKAAIVDEMKNAYAKLGDTDGVYPADASAVLLGIVLAEKFYQESD